MAIDWLAAYREEDLGPDDVDVTSDALFGSARGQARLVARQRCVVAGAAVAVDLLAEAGVGATVRVEDESWVEAGATILDVEGPAGAILRTERLALNIMARMAGIATATRQVAEALARAGCVAMVAGTRKTTPGFRIFEKEAIRIGGGDPHRMGLYDMAMIKDNHIAAAGSITQAVGRIRAAHDVPIEVEVECLEQAMEAAAAGADWILIDNQEPGTGAAWAKTVRDRHPRVKIEASGGITADNAAEHGWADRVSMGALTQNPRLPDLGLDWVPSHEASAPADAEVSR